MTSRDGKKHIIETDERDWIFHPDGDDLAALLVSFDPKKLRFSHISNRDLLSKHDAMTLGVGIGDDVFVVGRFINHEGRQKNSPTARFGHIGQMPNEPIRMGRHDQECFLVEARSIGGFSGSPVFWQVLPFAGGVYRPKSANQIGPLLLGVEAGYINDWTPVCDSLGRPINQAEPDRLQVRVNAGMMVVIPAWKLTELLHEDSLVAKRKQVEDQVKAEEKKTRGGVTLSSRRGPSATEDNPAHQEDFDSLLRKAAKVRKEN